MAERRMFAKAVVETDGFYGLPAAAQALYLHLVMNADDEGFVGSPIMIQKMTGAKPKDTDLLKKKGFIIPFDTGVIVIAHWRVSNELKKGRCKETIYQNEKIHLRITKTKAYEYVSEPVQELETDCIQNVSKMDTDCIQNVSKMETDWQPNGNQIGDKLETQYSIGKNKVDKDKINKGSLKEVSVVESTNLPTNLEDSLVSLCRNCFAEYNESMTKPLKGLIRTYGTTVMEKAINRAMDGGEGKQNLAYIRKTASYIVEDLREELKEDLKEENKDPLAMLAQEMENNYLETGGENEN